jgi:hypothetical protein
MSFMVALSKPLGSVSQIRVDVETSRAVLEIALKDRNTIDAVRAQVTG